MPTSSYKTARSSPSQNTSRTTSNAKHTKKRSAPNTNNSAQSTLAKRVRVPLKLPPVGSLIYRHYGTTVNGGPVGDSIYGVIQHRGTTAIAKEMRVVGRNTNRINNGYRATQLVPHGIDPSGDVIAVHAASRGVWRDAHHEYRQLGYGQTVESLVELNMQKFNALRKKAAATKIQAAWRKYENFSRSVAQIPEVQAALNSSKYMIHISSHGAIVPGQTFVVPFNVVIIFTTTPGAPAFSYLNDTISVNRVRKMIRGKNTGYTVAYFEGDTVSEHVLTFDDPNAPYSGGPHGEFGLFQILPEDVQFTIEYGALSNDSYLYEPRSLGIRHNAWQKAKRGNFQNASRRDLSEIVRYLARVHELKNPREPLILVVHACRVCRNNNSVKVHVARNVAAKRRVSGPRYTLPSTVQGVKGVGMTPYLKKLYRQHQKNELNQDNKKIAEFVDNLRNAGLLKKQFTKGLGGRR